MLYENDWHGGPPSRQSRSPGRRLASASNSLPVSSEIGHSKNDAPGKLWRNVEPAVLSRSVPDRTAKPAWRNPCASPPAPAKRSMHVCCWTEA